jgi:hypothetical protein
MQAIEELGHFQLPGIVYRSLRHCPCIIMLKHEVMAGNEWHDNGPQDLVTVSLCIQIVIDKTALCSLSIAYACPNHNCMGHSVHNVDIRKRLAHTTPYRGLIREEHTSPAFLARALVDIPAVSMPVALFQNI